MRQTIYGGRLLLAIALVIATRWSTVFMSPNVISVTRLYFLCKGIENYSFGQLSTLKSNIFSTRKLSTEQARIQDFCQGREPRDWWPYMGWGWAIFDIPSQTQICNFSRCFLPTISYICVQVTLMMNNVTRWSEVETGFDAIFIKNKFSPNLLNGRIDEDRARSKQSLKRRPWPLPSDRDIPGNRQNLESKV